MISAPNMPFDVILSLDRAPRSTRIARICSLSRCSQKVTKQIQWRLRLTTRQLGGLNTQWFRVMARR